MVDHGDQVLTLATQIVTSHVSHNQMTSQDVVGFLNDVVKTLRKHQSGDDLPNVNAVNAKAETVAETPLATRAMNAFEGVTIKPRERGRPLGSKNKKTLARAMIQDELDQQGSHDADEDEVVELRPAVPIKRSVFNDYIICLEDGKKMKMLKRHLSSSYKMTPEQYRAKWGLPETYPMVAPAYAERRSQLAKDSGLGRGASKSRLMEIVNQQNSTK